MKKEELDNLKAKYLAGNTSLEEERRLKELEDDMYFSSLAKPKEEMTWDFNAFMDKVENVEEIETTGKVKSLYRKLLPVLSIAAALIIGFFISRPYFTNQEKEIENQIAQVNPKDEIIPQEAAKEIEKIPELKETESSPFQNVKQVKQNETRSQLASNKPKKNLNKATVAEEENEFYVEVNGVRIYDEEKALEITESAIHLATNNLKSGIKGIEKIKHLSIEI